MKSNPIDSKGSARQSRYIGTDGLVSFLGDEIERRSADERQHGYQQWGIWVAIATMLVYAYHFVVSYGIQLVPWSLVLLQGLILLAVTRTLWTLRRMLLYAWRIGRLFGQLRTTSVLHQFEAAQSISFIVVSHLLFTAVGIILVVTLISGYRHVVLVIWALALQLVLPLVLVSALWLKRRNLPSELPNLADFSFGMAQSPVVTRVVMMLGCLVELGVLCFILVFVRGNSDALLSTRSFELLSISLPLSGSLVLLHLMRSRRISSVTTQRLVHLRYEIVRNDLDFEEAASLMDDFYMGAEAGEWLKTRYVSLFEDAKLLEDAYAETLKQISEIVSNSPSSSDEIRQVLERANLQLRSMRDSLIGRVFEIRNVLMHLNTVGYAPNHIQPAPSDAILILEQFVTVTLDEEETFPQALSRIITGGGEET